MAPQPLVTIVTPCLNRVGMIAAAIESVRDQDFDGPVEHVVMDGGSTDGTLEVLARYPNLTVVSEPDENLYDALNKGITRAKAPIIGLLNSDDTYRPNSIRNAVDAFEASPAASMVCGGADVLDENGHVLMRYDGVESRDLAPANLLFGIPIINARFFRRALFDRVGFFDIRYGLVADREFLLRASLAGEVAEPMAGIAYQYRSHAGSLTIGGVGTRQRLAEDYVRMTETWLDRSPLPPAVVSDLKRLHAQSMLVCAMATIRDRDSAAFAACLARGHKANAWWPLVAVGAVGAWMGRRLRAERR